MVARSAPRDFSGALLCDKHEYQYNEARDGGVGPSRPPAAPPRPGGARTTPASGAYDADLNVVVTFTTADARAPSRRCCAAGRGFQ